MKVWKQGLLGALAWALALSMSTAAQKASPEKASPQAGSPKAAVVIPADLTGKLAALC